MKVLYLIICLFLIPKIISQNIPSIGSNQNKTLLTGSYEFIESIPQQFKIQLDENDNSIPIKRGRKIRLEFEKNDRIYFSYWSFKKGSNLYKKYNWDGDKNSDDIALKVFSIEKSLLEELATPLYRRYKGASFGAYTIPLRLRGLYSRDFDFESSLSLQANLIFGFGTRYSQESWFDLSFGVGITGISLNNKNAKFRDNREEPFEERTANAVTFSFGSVIKANRFANLGLFVGWDFLDVDDSEIDWVHDGNVWYGLGINVTFTKVDTEKSANGNNSN